jgi:iron complex transport system substrate-binding protein
VPLLAVTLMLALVGCGNAATPVGSGGTLNENSADAPNVAPAERIAVGPVSFTDSLGYEVRVEDPQRVVACMGSFANIWELAGGTLVGASDDAFGDYGLASEGIAKIGDFTAPNIEAIIALDPDLVIMTGISTGRAGAASQTDLRQTLVDSGIPVAYFNVTTFPDYLEMLRICCEITGRDDLFAEYGEAVAARIEAITAAVPAASSGTAPRVLTMIPYSGGIRVQGSETQTGAIFADLGVTNLTDENPSLLRDFSLEAVIDLNPDYIFVLPMGFSDEETKRALEAATSANPAWNTLSAIQNGHYYLLEKEYFLYKPNNRWDKSYEILFKHLYG